MSSDPNNTVSRCATKTAQGTHSFEITGYNLQKGIGVGNFVQSGTFAVGGYDWVIRFYPDGDGSSEIFERYVSISLVLLSSNARVRALYDLCLVNQVSGSKELMVSATTPKMCRSCHATVPIACLVIIRSKLEQNLAGYIVEDRVTIQCNLTVVMDTQVLKTKGDTEILVPPSNLSNHLGKLWLDEETADVVFIVEGDAIPAHKLLLATRSPVFKAELHGHMKERTERCITLEDMKPDVFKALLHFAYTDDLPEWGDLDDGEYCKIVRHLLVAADRYAMDRLKLVCASILQKFLGVENVATMLSFADQNNCQSLRDVCIEFMASTDYLDDVMATQGYADLKATCPSILVEVLERARKFRKGNMN